MGTSLLPLAVALLIGIPAFGSCIGIGLATMKFLESAARQPELIPELQTKWRRSLLRCHQQSTAARLSARAAAIAIIHRLTR